MADEDDRPYTTYKARPRFLQGRDDDGLDPRGGERPEYEVHGRRRRFRLPGRRGGGGGARKLSLGRIVRYLAFAAVAWVLLSAILFLVSAQIQESKISNAAEQRLSGGGYTLTSPNTVLVLGSDARPKGTKEAGANVIGTPSRSDSIMLMRVGGGKNATLSIPRDTVVDIPGHGRNKINAAYALGGPSLAIETVESYLGIKVNHLVEVNFENFPQLIDSLGGVTYKGGCVISRINGGSRNGGYTLRLKAGEHEIDGKQALALARTRKNECNTREDDRTRAHRQQKILAAIKDKVISRRDLRPPAVGQLGRAARRPVRHGRPVAARPRRRRADRRRSEVARAQALGRGHAARRRGRPRRGRRREAASGARGS